MPAMVNLLYLIHYVLMIYMLIVVVRVLISWVNPDPYNPFVRFLCQVTDPVLYRVRQTIPLPRTGIDLSPIIVLVIITFFDSFVTKTIRDLTFGINVSIFANLTYAFIMAIHDILRIYMIILIVRAVISWVNPDPYNPIVRFLYEVTEPVLYRVRRAIPLPMTGIDFSPMFVIIVIYIIDSYLVKALI